jgi:hypothetical protein
MVARHDCWRREGVLIASREKREVVLELVLKGAELVVVDLSVPTTGRLRGRGGKAEQDIRKTAVLAFDHELEGAVHFAGVLGVVSEGAGSEDVDLAGTLTLGVEILVREPDVKAELMKRLAHLDLKRVARLVN